MKKDFLSLLELSSVDVTNLLKKALDLKTGVDADARPLSGRSVGMLFEKPSTRTRVSFEVGIYQLGGQPVYMNPSELQLGRGESLSDTAGILSRYLSGIVIRTSTHTTLETFASSASIPVINGLSDRHHPCQALADLMTIQENKKRLKGLKVAFIGDGNNVCNSLIEAAALMEFDLDIACPEGFEPDAGILENARASARSEIVILRDPQEAAGMADVIYTDVWISMGQEKDADKKKRKLGDYQVNSRLLACAKKDAIVLHCLPAHRGEEITGEVMDGPHSVIFDQAENRLHTQKALLDFLIK